MIYNSAWNFEGSIYRIRFLEPRKNQRPYRKNPLIHFQIDIYNKFVSYEHTNRSQSDALFYVPQHGIARIWCCGSFISRRVTTGRFQRHPLVDLSQQVGPTWTCGRCWGSSWRHVVQRTQRRWWRRWWGRWWGWSGSDTSATSEKLLWRWRWTWGWWRGPWTPRGGFCGSLGRQSRQFSVPQRRRWSLNR